jgi:hypothetical protein
MESENMSQMKTPKRKAAGTKRTSGEILRDMIKLGETCMANIGRLVEAAKILWDQCIFSYGSFFESFPSGKMRCSRGILKRSDFNSCNVWRSSSRRRKSKYVICLITSSGFVIPQVQKAFHIWSIWLDSSPA